MLRKYLSILVIVATIITIGTFAGIPAKAQDKVEIKVMIATNELSDDEMAAFMKANPDITLTRVTPDTTVFNSMLAAGTPPDVIRTAAFDVPRYVNQAILLDLTSMIKASKVLDVKDMSPSVKYFVVNNSYYGMPKDWSPDFSIFVSDAAFKEAGLDIPSTTKSLTYDELATLATKLTKKQGDRTLRFGLGYDFLERQVALMLAEKGEQLYSKDYTQINLTSNPDAIAALKYFYDLAAAGVTPSPLNPAVSWPGQDFMDGKYAILIYGYWFGGMVNGLKSDSPFYNAVTMLPGATWGSDGKRYNPSWGPSGIGIAALTKHPQEAFRFFEWYEAGQPAKTRAASGWGVPVLTSLQSLMPQDTPFEKAAFAQVQSESKLSDLVIPVNPYYDSQLFNTSWNTHLEEVLRGTKTFDDMVKDIETDVNQAISDGISQSVATPAQ